MDGRNCEGTRARRWDRAGWVGLYAGAAALLVGGCGTERGRADAAGQLGPRGEPVGTIPIIIEAAPDSGRVLERLPAPIVLQVRASDGELRRGARLRLVPAGDDSVGTSVVAVGADGRATITDWHLGAAEGEHRLVAELLVPGDSTVRGLAEVRVQAGAVRGQGAVELVSPSWALTARRGLSLPRPLELRVRDATGRPLADADVRLVTTGGQVRVGATWRDARRGIQLRADADGVVRIADWALPTDSASATMHAAVRDVGAVQLTRRGTPAAEPTLRSSVFFETTHFIWDMAFAPDSTFFYTRRDRGLAARLRDGTIIEYPAPEDAPVGAMQFMYGLALDPDFARTHWLYVVQAADRGEVRDLRLVRYRVSRDYRRLEQRTDLRTGFYRGSGGGREWHMSVRGGIVRFRPDSTLIVTIGFGHDLETAQSLTLDAAKTFHLRRDGSPAPSAGQVSGAAPDLFTMGHRNPQGLVIDQRRGAVFLSEHGPGYDDEVNRLEQGRNYGWFPICDDGVGNCEYVMEPARFMTDFLRIPSATAPLWRSGAPAWGTSGLVLLEGGQWGAWDGRLLALQLRGKRGVLLGLNEAGTAVTDWRYVLEGSPRLRTGIIGPDGALYVAPDSLPVLRIEPQLP